MYPWKNEGSSATRPSRSSGREGELGPTVSTAGPAPPPSSVVVVAVDAGAGVGEDGDPAGVAARCSGDSNCPLVSSGSSRTIASAAAAAAAAGVLTGGGLTEKPRPLIVRRGVRPLGGVTVARGVGGDEWGEMV